MTAATFCSTEATSATDALAHRNELWQLYSQTGPGSAEENDLVQQYLPLVKTVVGRIAMSLPSHVDAQDLYSAGLVGLLNAVRRFDAKSGVAFETYARVRIRGAIYDELRRLGWGAPSVRDKARKVEGAMRKLEQRKGKAPTEMEMARELGLSLDDYQKLVEEIRPATFVCLDSARNLDSDDGATQYESVPDPSQPDPGYGASQRELARLIAERLEELPDMQRKVLALYYFEDLRLREIAEIFGVTESRICQIHSQAILSIKTYIQKREAR